MDTKVFNKTTNQLDSNKSDELSWTSLTEFFNSNKLLRNFGFNET